MNWRDKVISYVFPAMSVVTLVATAFVILFPSLLPKAKNVKQPMVKRIKIDSNRCYTLKEWDIIREQEKDEEDSLIQGDYEQNGY